MYMALGVTSSFGIWFNPALYILLLISLKDHQQENRSG